MTEGREIHLLEILLHDQLIQVFDDVISEANPSGRDIQIGIEGKGAESIWPKVQIFVSKFLSSTN